MNKVYGSKTKYQYFKVKEVKTGKWFPRAVTESIVDDILDKWDEAGLQYEEITEAEYNNFYTQVDR